MAGFNKKTLVLIVSFLCLLFFYVSCDKEEHGAKSNKILTKKQILKIANKKAKALDIPLKKSRIQYDVDKAEWQKNLNFMNDIDPNWPKEYEILNGRDYVIVKYSPKGINVLGGVLWLFIDRKTGEVITYSLEL